MKKSTQDNYYLNIEGDSFFTRTHQLDSKDEIRPNKEKILNTLRNTIDLNSINNILEYGCNYGDLLNFLNQKYALNTFGIEASKKAVDYGKQLYKENISLYQGTIADNIVNKNEKYNNYFDLIIIEDVFGWVSRETLFQSIANIDSILKDGGYIFIRDFYMNQRVKNKNIHIENENIYCYKVADGYSKIFIDSGMYEIISQNIWNDSDLKLTGKFKTTREFENRWSDTILKKSYNNYYI